MELLIHSGLIRSCDREGIEMQVRRVSGSAVLAKPIKITPLWPRETIIKSQLSELELEETNTGVRTPRYAPVPKLRTSEIQDLCVSPVPLLPPVSPKM